jgi:hypothetical protein
MPRARFDDLTKGLSLRDPQLIDDNQFTELKNFYYNADLRLQSRRGIKTYFPVVPDTVVLIDALDATTGWSASDDAINLAQDTAIRGANSISFDVDVSNSGDDFATLTKSTLSADISDTKDYLGMWIYVPSGFNTGLTAVKLRLGTDSSNYYEFTFPTLTAGADNFVKLSFSDATTTGTLDDSSIAYARLQITYAGTYLDQVGIKLDGLQAYSSTYTTPVTSYFFNRNEADQTNITICVAGANMFLLNETANAWERINSGLTEYETREDQTTHRTRWEFFAYNGSGTMEVGMCNGVDEYRKWDGTTITQYGAQPKCRYFLVFEDVIFSTGADANPLTVYYTGASPANVNTLDTNNVDVGNEADGRTNGLFPLTQSVMVGKDQKVYYFDDVNGVCSPLDAQNGMFSQRAVSEVGNGILILTQSGVDLLRQKKASAGVSAVEGVGYSDDLQPYFDKITNNQLNANCGLYSKELHNYYIQFDTGDDNVPDTTLVYSSLIGKSWTEYTYPAAYSFGVYVDSSNIRHLLLCSGNAGIIYEIETGWDDDGVPIDYSFTTKKYNLKTPYEWKDFDYVTISGLKNEGSEAEFEVLVDGDSVYSATLDDTYLTTTDSVATIATNPVATEATGGGGGESNAGIDVFPYQIRLGAEIFASGQTIQIKGTSSSSPFVFTLDRFEIKHEGVSDDLFPTANFA